MKGLNLWYVAKEQVRKGGLPPLSPNSGGKPPFLTCSFIESLKWRPAGEARIDVVPPLQLVAFAELPAEQYDAPVA